MSAQEISRKERSGYVTVYNGPRVPKDGTKESCFGEEQRRPTHPARSFCGLSKGLSIGGRTPSSPRQNSTVLSVLTI